MGDTHHWWAREEGMTSSLTFPTTNSTTEATSPYVAIQLWRTHASASSQVKTTHLWFCLFFFLKKVWLATMPQKKKYLKSFYLFFFFFFFPTTQNNYMQNAGGKHWKSLAISNWQSFIFFLKKKKVIPSAVVPLLHTKSNEWLWKDSQAGIKLQAGSRSETRGFGREKRKKKTQRGNGVLYARGNANMKLNTKLLLKFNHFKSQFIPQKWKRPWRNT